MRYVIIGNSTAGIAAVEAIRRQDQAGDITIVSNEPEHTYSRPLISYLLLGKTTEAGMRYRSPDFYDSMRCTLLAGKTAVAIDKAAKTVQLDDGSALPYDKLLVATGSSPFVPPMDGLEAVTQKTTFSSLADARTLERMLTAESRVLILGAGLIGLKCAEGIRQRVASVTVVDLAPRVLSSILDDDASAMVQAHLEANGLQFHLGESVQRFQGNTATLTGGETLAFDILVLAVGVRANTALVKALDGVVGRGIRINHRMETTIPDIYAAGDCTESEDCASGTVKVMALLPNAYQQGECAGTNMAGGKQIFDKAIPMNAIGLFGLHMMTAGSYTGQVFSRRTDKTMKKLFYSDNRLQGFILLGDVARAGIYTAMLRERRPLDQTDFALLCERPMLAAFAADERKRMLGGAEG